MSRGNIVSLLMLKLWASFARASTTLLPCIPTCPGIHWIVVIIPVSAKSFILLLILLVMCEWLVKISFLSAINPERVTEYHCISFFHEFSVN